MTSPHRADARLKRRLMSAASRTVSAVLDLLLLFFDRVDKQHIQALVLHARDFAFVVGEGQGWRDFGATSRPSREAVTRIVLVNSNHLFQPKQNRNRYLFTRSAGRQIFRTQSGRTRYRRSRLD